MAREIFDGCYRPQRGEGVAEISNRGGSGANFQFGKTAAEIIDWNTVDIKVVNEDNLIIPEVLLQDLECDEIRAFMTSQFNRAWSGWLEDSKKPRYNSRGDIINDQ